MSKRKCWNYARLLNDDRISEDSWNFRSSLEQRSHLLESLYNSRKSLALVRNYANCMRFLKSWSRMSHALHDSWIWTRQKLCKILQETLILREITSSHRKDPKRFERKVSTFETVKIRLEIPNSWETWRLREKTRWFVAEALESSVYKTRWWNPSNIDFTMVYPSSFAFILHLPVTLVGNQNCENQNRLWSFHCDLRVVRSFQKISSEK